MQEASAPEPREIGIVLAGAAALGAFEAGVLDYIADKVAADLGRPLPLDVLSGASAGAINAAALAAGADDPRTAAGELCDVWTRLELDRVLRPSAREVLGMLAETGLAPRSLRRAVGAWRLRGGLLDPGPIRAIVRGSLRLDRVPEHLARGRLRALVVATTQVATGRAVLFYAGAAAPWTSTGNVAPVPATIGLDHVIASASIPLLFPAVEIDGELYCDGGLRQVIPLSPAIHLGARRLLVVNPLATTSPTTAIDATLRREAVASPLYLAGKALDALFADRLDIDLARLDQLNAIVRAGERRFGPGFAAGLDAELRAVGAAPIEPVTALRVDPSVDLGALAAAYVLEPRFARRACGPVSSLLVRIADAGATRAGDLLSYLLFDGGFAAELIAQGRADARAKHAELVALFAGGAS